MQLSADGRYLLAADAGSNEISVLRIKPDGGLTEAEGSPVWSGGNEPVSIAVHDNLVYVANAGNGASNYTGFTLNAGGHLTAPRPARRSRCPMAHRRGMSSSTATEAVSSVRGSAPR